MNHAAMHNDIFTATYSLGSVPPEPKAGEPRARRGNARQRGRAVGAGLPGRRLAPPVAVEHNVPRVVRDDAVGVVPVNLSVEVHVGDGQVPLAKGIIAKIGVGQRCRCRIFVQHISACGDELVRRVVLVRGDEECAAETRAGFGDGATECVFVGTTPTRGVETRRAFVGLGPVRAVFVGGLHDAVEERFLGATVGVGDGRVGDGAVRAERADRRARLESRR